MSGTLTLKADARQKVIARLDVDGVRPVAFNAQHLHENAMRERREAVKRFRARLAIECPHTFSQFDHGPHVALAIGIRRQLTERYPDIPTKTRRWLLKDYTGSAAYLRLLTVGAPRVDIDGNATGKVTEAEAAHAAETLKNLFHGNASQQRGTDERVYPHSSRSA